MGTLVKSPATMRLTVIMSDEANFVLRWDLHEENRTSRFKTLWKDEDFLDVTIACDDDQIDAHKVILSSASTFLKGTTSKEVKSLLEFIYSGETEVPQEELESFMAMANSLKVGGLMGDLSKQSESFEVLNNIDDENPVKI